MAFTFEAMEIALYHNLGRLPELKQTNELGGGSMSPESSLTGNQGTNARTSPSQRGWSRVNNSRATEVFGYKSVIERVTRGYCREVVLRLWAARTALLLLAFIVANEVVVDSGPPLIKHYARHLKGGRPANLEMLKTVLRRKQHDDSIVPMLAALHFIQAHPRSDVYGRVFFEDHIKFQYPLSSLIPFFILQELGVTDARLASILNIITLVSVYLTVVLSVAIALKCVRARRPLDNVSTIITIFTVALSGFLFYPLTKGYSLGQIQPLVTLGFSIAVVCWMSGCEKTAGALMALMALVKPQFALFSLWAAIRRRWGALVSSVVCGSGGVLLSCLLFGWRSNLRYLDVLRYIGHHGEGFNPNQSMNGLLNRLFFNGNNLVWDPANFAPYHPVVYFGTTVTSIAIILLALFYPWGRDRQGSVFDFASFSILTTIASPVAWEHHFGLLLPIFGLLWFSESANRMDSRRVLFLAAAYVSTSNFIPWTGEFAARPILNISQSYLLAGTIIVAALLLSSPWHIPHRRALCAVGSE